MSDTINDILKVIEQSLGGYREMGSKLSGHRGHKGRKGKRGGSLPSKGTISGVKRMIPVKNLNDLGLKGGGVWGATIKGKEIEEIAHGAMYNPKTDTLLVGKMGHEYLHQDYAPDQPFDDFVKFHLGFPEMPKIKGLERFHKTVNIYLDRHQAKDVTDAWDKAFKTAKALKGAGIPGDVKVSFEYWEKKSVASEVLLEEM